MTALTPQQMRELADKLVERASLERHGSYDEWLDSASYTALRTGADQLEALRAVVRQLSHATARRLLEEALGTADTAPQDAP